jgi:membrane associated rhomboid family serine protease
MIPISDSPRRSATPWVTYAIILANVAVFVYMLTLSTATPPPQTRTYERAAIALADGPCYGFPAAPSDSDSFVCKYAFQPKEFVDNLKGASDVSRPDRPIILISILTGLFLHAGWLHLLGNMLFLWVFGDNVEDRLGHAGYLLFYLVAGMVAAVVQGLIQPASVVPVLGASGAIAAVLGAYIVYFPRASVRVVIPFFILIFIPIPVPAWLMIGLWFVQNLFAGLRASTRRRAPKRAWRSSRTSAGLSLAVRWLSRCFADRRARSQERDRHRAPRCPRHDGVGRLRHRVRKTGLRRQQRSKV